MKINNVIYLFVVILHSSCSLDNTVEDYVHEIKKENVYHEVRSAFVDTFLVWNSKGLRIGCSNNTEFTLDDAIFFNSDRTRCLLLGIRRQKSAIDSLTPGTNSIKVFAGELIHGSWQFYTQGYVVFSYLLRYHEFKNYSIAYLSDDARRDIASKGFLNFYGEINSNFLNDSVWFNNDYRSLHKNVFLKQKISFEIPEIEVLSQDGGILGRFQTLEEHSEVIFYGESWFDGGIHKITIMVSPNDEIYKFSTTLSDAYLIFDKPVVFKCESKRINGVTLYLHFELNIGSQVLFGEFNVSEPTAIEDCLNNIETTCAESIRPGFDVYRPAVKAFLTRVVGRHNKAG